MKKRTLYISITIMLLIIGGVLGVMQMVERAKKDNELEMRQMEIRQAYADLHFAFYCANDTDLSILPDYCYEYVRLIRSSNPYGVFTRTYISLKLFEQKTGNVLEHDDAIEYFQQEYEEDGELRLYNNGRHPEIEAYVDWMQSNRPAAEVYIEKIFSVYFTYIYEDYSIDFEWVNFYDLTSFMLDELIKKEADPDYDLDLVSLQQQGY